ncbi:MAG: hypothetical protein KGQ49_00310 [Verrucomicrobia bacterium]|nr:hypothetical protein [Verrucomicrobiota bacterium]MBU6445822.1 hypothetical protein [Verrucomicrobiota bacterium]MDE3047515.1 hypothetical protein [Verrucomicrobiota bacterium]
MNKIFSTTVSQFLFIGLALGLYAQPVERFQFSEQTRQYFSEELPPSAQKKGPHGSHTAKKVKITTCPMEEGGWQARFSFPYPVKVTHRIEGNRLYVDFNQTIDSPDLTDMQERLSYLISQFSNGVHTLYLAGKRDVSYQVASGDQWVEITIMPKEIDPAVSSRSLKIACARLQVENRHYKQGFAALDPLQDTQDKDVAVLLAELEGLVPLWQRQVQVLDSALAQDPLDEDLYRLRQEAFSPHSSFLAYEWQWQDTLTLAIIRVNRVQEEAIIQRTYDHTLYLGADYQLWSGHVNSLSNTQGADVPFTGARNQGSVSLRNEWENGNFCKGTFYLQEQNVYGGGIAAGCLVPPLQGQFWISADYHRPCWEIFEAFAYHGREDKVEFQLTSVYNRYVNWEIGGGGRRVGITHTPTGYASILAHAEVDINLIITNPILAFHYSYEAEYVEYLKTKIGVEGPYNPVPLTSFEFHTVSAYLYFTCRENLFITIYGGETFNRLGIKSPNAGIEVKYVKPCRFEMQMGAYQFPSQVAPGTAERFVLARVTARF